MNEICLSCKKHTKCGRAKVETIGCSFYAPLTNDTRIKCDMCNGSGEIPIVECGFPGMAEEIKKIKWRMILEQGQIDDYHNCMRGVSENYRKGII